MARKVISSALRPQLTPNDLTRLEYPDATIEALRTRAQNNDTDARADLLTWAALTARNYFYLKYQKGEVHSSDEAETLAADFLLEFEHTLPRLQQAARWTRVMLTRYVTYKRHREKRHVERTVVTDPQTIAEVESAPASDPNRHPSNTWDDAQWRTLQMTLQVLNKQPETTRNILKRIFWEDPPPSYQELAALHNTSEAAIKMRVSRFYKAVRKKLGHSR